MALQKVRKTAIEMQLEAQITQLFMLLDHLAIGIKAALPHSPVPDLRGMMNGGNSYQPLYATSQPGMQSIDLTGDAIIDGHGPRFVSMYNLARTDEERQALLDSLPQYRSGADHYWEQLLQEYRTHEYPCGTDGGGSTNRPLAKEFDLWLSKRRCEGPIINHEGTLYTITSQFDYPVTVGDRVEIPNDILFVKTTGKEKVQAPGEFVLLSCPETMSYVVLRVDLVNYSGQGIRLRVEVDSNIQWSAHELCWVHLNRERKDGPAFNSAIDRWLEEMGYPQLEPVSDEDMGDVALRAWERLKNDWIADINRDKIESRTITLDGCLRLKIEPPTTNYYSNEWRIVAYLLDTEEDTSAHTNFQLCWVKGYGADPSRLRPFFYLEEDDRSFDAGKMKNVFRHHKRQRARVKALLERFINTPNESLAINDEIRSSWVEPSDGE